MGISERDYGRYNPPGHGQFGSMAGRMGGRGRSFSVTTWIIIACVAIFVIDGFLQAYSSWVETGTRYVDNGNGTWTEVVANPNFGNSYLPSDGDSGTPVSVTINLVTRDDQIVKKEVTGLGVLLKSKTGDGPEIAQRAIVVVTPMSPLQRWLHFSTWKVIGGGQIWRLVGFQFLHADMTHLLFNMIALFFFGPLVERFLGGKRYLAFYLLCGVFGSLLYLFLNMAGWVWIDQLGWPPIGGLLFNATGVPLIGASAGVFGVIVGGAILHPNVRVLLMFIIPMRLGTLAVVLIAISIIFILFGLENAGGEAAHLGGAIAGWYFIRRPEQLHGLFNFFGRVDPTSRHFAMKGARLPGTRRGNMDQVDKILDKISREGLQSLSKKEKRILNDASRRDKKNR